MNIAPNRNAHRARHAAPTWRRLRDQLNDRRRSRARRATLERELATYRTTSDINDLLVAISHEEGPDAELIRTILTQNQAEHSLAERTGWVAH